jgi:hypothetical protein
MTLCVWFLNYKTSIFFLCQTVAWKPTHEFLYNMCTYDHLFSTVCFNWKKISHYYDWFMCQRLCYDAEIMLIHRTISGLKMNILFDCTITGAWSIITVRSGTQTRCSNIQHTIWVFTCKILVITSNLVQQAFWEMCHDLRDKVHLLVCWGICLNFKHKQQQVVFWVEGQNQFQEYQKMYPVMK